MVWLQGGRRHPVERHLLRQVVPVLSVKAAERSAKARAEAGRYRVRVVAP